MKLLKADTGETHYMTAENNTKDITYDSLLQKEEYSFLKTNEHLNDNILALGLGGSLAYGTNNENSDTDIRGVALNKIDDLLLGYDFEQVVDVNTDTVIYSLKKIFNLLAKCNPNTIEILGLSDNQMIYTTPLWEKVRKNKEIFLSKRCIGTFGGYANAQLRRLETKSARSIGQAKREAYIIGSIENAGTEFSKNYAKIPSDALKLYIDKSAKEDYDTEIMLDVSLTHYPLRDFASLINDYHSVIRDYDKIGKRNSKAIEHAKLGKHMMHLVRLYYMVFDILEKGEITTYRDKEHDLLMSIRNGDYLIDGVRPTDKFYELVDSLDKRLNKAKEDTLLPDEPNYEKINALYLDIVRSKNR